MQHSSSVHYVVKKKFMVKDMFTDQTYHLGKVTLEVSVLMIEYFSCCVFWIMDGVKCAILLAWIGAEIAMEKKGILVR